MTTKRVLICDDEPQLREMIASWLSGLGFSVTEATDGAECLQMLSQVRPDVIVLDLNMPKVNGINVLRKISDQNLSIPVIILSGASSKPSMSELERLGQSNFMNKPFAMSQLVSKIDRLCKN